MKKLLILLGLTISLTAFSQDLYLTKTAEISFFSKTPLEDIEAENNSVTSILKANEGKVAFKVLMKSFHFEKAAMEQHFNDDYVHSDEFPKATYDAVIVDFEQIDFKEDGNHEVTTNGKLTLHGVTKEFQAKGSIAIKDGNIQMTSSFDIELSDFDIKVPTNFLKRINNTINVSVKAVLEPYER